MTDQPRRRCPHPGVAHDPHDWTDTRQMTWRCPGTPVTDPAPAGRDVDPRPYLNHPGHEHTAGHHAAEATRHVAALHEAVGRLTVERDTLAGANEALQRGAEQLQRELSEEIRRTGNATEEIGRLRASISERNERHTRELDARAESVAILKAELADVRLEAMAARTDADRYRAALERIAARGECPYPDPETTFAEGYEQALRDIRPIAASALSSETPHGSDEKAPQTPEPPAPVPEAGSTETEPAKRSTGPRCRHGVLLGHLCSECDA